MTDRLTEHLQTEDIDSHVRSLYSFLSVKVEQDPNWKFGGDFVFSTCFPYIAFSFPYVQAIGILD